jgi:hypothetical protein
MIQKSKESMVEFHQIYLMRKYARRMHGCNSHAIINIRKEIQHGDMHLEIIFEGQIMISCKSNICKW